MPHGATKWTPSPKRSPKRRRRITASLRHWRQAVAFYDRNKSRLLKDRRYRGKFIAIRHNRLVDVDDNESTLAKRLFLRFPDQIFFVKQVLRVEPIYEVPSIVTCG
ncbi:MAG TPA: hypothetical protein VM008_22060 [Phycisphaerae bacterium]|nr:hypothetical protein [Phycisphaerae bacterium]